MPEVVSIASVWRDRARVAEEAAAELDRLLLDAGRIVRVNYFGVDCVEGAALFTQLSQYLAGWRTDTAEASEQLRSVANRCDDAGASFTAADDAAAGGIEG